MQGQLTIQDAQSNPHSKIRTLKIFILKGIL